MCLQGQVTLVTYISTVIKYILCIYSVYTLIFVCYAGTKLWNYCIVSDVSAGDSQDYAAAVANIKYAFAVELRGGGPPLGGPVATPPDINLSFQEIWAGLVSMVKEIKKITWLSGSYQSVDC